MQKGPALWAFYILASSVLESFDNVMKYMGKTIIKKISHCGKIGIKH
jgi:hypothetical protein